MPPSLAYASTSFLAVVLSVGLAAFALVAAQLLQCFAQRFSRRPFRPVPLQRVSVLGAPSPSHGRAEVVFEALSAATSTRTLLHPFSGTLRSGCLVALMGPSGCGKTTALSILAGEPTSFKASGEVKLNGETVSAATRRRTFGFAPQADTLPPWLTCREAVWFSCELRRPALHASTSQAPSPLSSTASSSPASSSSAASVDEALSALGLSGAASGARCSSLSGGERRRTTLACELALRPPVLLLDEPTSGCDARTALRVVDAMCSALFCDTVILVSVHSPGGEALSRFGQVMLLAPDGGGLLWSCAPRDAPHFFAEAGCPVPAVPGGRSDAEHLLFVAEGCRIDGDEGDAAVRGRVASLLLAASATAGFREAGVKAEAGENGGVPTGDEVAPPLAAVEATVAAPPRRQLSALLWREAAHHARAPALLAGHILVSLGMAVFLGLVYRNLDLTIVGFQNRLGVAFFSASFFGLSSLSACDALLAERTLVAKESRRYYHPACYVATKLTFDFVMLRALPVVLYTCILYFMIGFQPSAAHFFFFLSALTCCSLASASLAALVSACSPSVGVSNLATSFFFLVSSLFGGLLTNTATLPAWLAWLRFTSFSFYTFEAIVSNELSGLEFVLGINGIQGLTFDGNSLLTSALSIDPTRVGADIVCTAVWFALLSAAAVAATSFRHA